MDSTTDKMENSNLPPIAAPDARGPIQSYRARPWWLPQTVQVPCQPEVYEQAAEKGASSSCPGDSSHPPQEAQPPPPQPPKPPAARTPDAEPDTKADAHCAKPAPTRKTRFQPVPRKRRREPKPKMNALKACVPCKRAHLSCDDTRPCKRCVGNKRSHACQDTEQRKRGRPRLPDAPVKLPFMSHPTVSGVQSALGSCTRPTSSSSATQEGGGSDPLQTPRATPCSSLEPDLKPTGVTTLPGSETFELLASLDFHIIRATPKMYPMTGHQPANLRAHSLLDYIHPSDRFLLMNEKNAFLGSFSHGHQFTTSRDILPALSQLPFDLLNRPIFDMPPVYPNTNCRVISTDGSVSWYNVRLHLGAAFGAATGIASTFGRNYLCVSFLRLHAAQSDKPGLGDNETMSPGTSTADPPTPANMTPLSTLGPLPSFPPLPWGLKTFEQIWQPPTRGNSPMTDMDHSLTSIFPNSGPSLAPRGSPLVYSGAQVQDPGWAGEVDQRRVDVPSAPGQRLCSSFFGPGEMLASAFQGSLQAGTTAGKTQPAPRLTMPREYYSYR